MPEPPCFRCDWYFSVLRNDDGCSGGCNARMVEHSARPGMAAESKSSSPTRTPGSWSGIGISSVSAGIGNCCCWLVSKEEMGMAARSLHHWHPGLGRPPEPDERGLHQRCNRRCYRRSAFSLSLPSADESAIYLTPGAISTLSAVDRTTVG